jgi:uncharacterized protein (DUF1697 family)
VKYVCLLRGINVGGNNIIPMSQLTAAFQRNGFANVRTLIASGNVVFEAPKHDLRKLEAKIEAALSREFAYAAKVVVKSDVELVKIMANLPSGWAKPKPDQRYYVIFLRHAIDDRAVLAELAPKPGVETLTYYPGVLFWQAKRALLGKSSVAKLTQKKIYADVTVRNMTTTAKLAAMLAPPPTSSESPRRPRSARAGSSPASGRSR